MVVSHEVRLLVTVLSARPKVFIGIGATTQTFWFGYSVTLHHSSSIPALDACSVAVDTFMRGLTSMAVLEPFHCFPLWALIPAVIPVLFSTLNPTREYVSQLPISYPNLLDCQSDQSYLKSHFGKCEVAQVVRRTIIVPSSR